MWKLNPQPIIQWSLFFAIFIKRFNLTLRFFKTTTLLISVVKSSGGSLIKVIIWSNEFIASNIDTERKQKGKKEHKTIQIKKNYEFMPWKLLKFAVKLSINIVM